MKRLIFTWVILCPFISCRGQINNNAHQIKIDSNLKDKKMIATKRFDVKRYFENRHGLFYEYQDSLNNEVAEYKDDEIYIQIIKLANSPIFSIHNEYYATGVMKSSGKFFDMIRCGIWYYYNEMGELINQVDEDKKFGKFGINELLQFLEKEKLIDTKTGKGEKYLSVNYATEKEANIEEKRKTQPWYPDKGQWGVRLFFMDEFYKYTYIIDGETGKVISHRNNELGKEFVK